MPDTYTRISELLIAADRYPEAVEMLTKGIQQTGDSGLSNYLNSVSAFSYDRVLLNTLAMAFINNNPIKYPVFGLLIEDVDNDGVEKLCLNTVQEQKGTSFIIDPTAEVTIGAYTDISAAGDAYWVQSKNTGKVYLYKFYSTVGTTSTWLT